MGQKYYKLELLYKMKAGPYRLAPPPQQSARTQSKRIRRAQAVGPKQVASNLALGDYLDISRGNNNANYNNKLAIF